MKNLTFLNMDITEDEADAMMVVLNEIRKKKQEERVINHYKERIFSAVRDSVDVIGKEKTKTFIREINKQLREEGL